MKIEIGESIVYSWLKHIKECKIVQLNWKVSENWDKNNWEKIEKIFEKINQQFNNPFNNKLEQLIKQAEIDVVGINDKTIYGVDVAFHINGLKYSDNVKSITKKIVRTLLIFELYFSSYEKNIYFITPKITPKELDNIKTILDEIKDFIESEKLNVSFGFIYNDLFKTDIIDELVKLSDDIADTSELFLRSYQLLNLFGEKKHKNVKTQKKNQKAMESNEIEEEIEKVKKRIPKWLENTDQINSKILIKFLKLSELCSKRISKEYFKESFKKDFPEIKFDDNYNQMKNIADRNHAKIFEEEDGYVYLWEKVRDFIINEYKKNFKYIESMELINF